MLVFLADLHDDVDLPDAGSILFTDAPAESTE